MEIPMTRLCRILDVPRSTAYHQPKVERLYRPVDEALARTIHEIIQTHPTYGVRRVWAWLKHRLDQPTNRKKIHRLMRIKGWTMRQRAIGKRPRVPGSRSIAPAPNQRWCTDIALIECGKDGWCAFVPVLDCCTREVLGWCLDLTGRAQTAERALEEALIHRFGWTHGAPKGLALRHDNGLVFGSRLYRALARDYGLKQEYITPYTPSRTASASGSTAPSKRNAPGSTDSRTSRRPVPGSPATSITTTTNALISRSITERPIRRSSTPNPQPEYPSNLSNYRGDTTRSLSTSHYPGFVQCLGAGGAG